MTTSPEMVADLIRNALAEARRYRASCWALACRIGACTVLMSAPLAISTDVREYGQECVASQQYVIYGMQYPDMRCRGGRFPLRQ